MKHSIILFLISISFFSYGQSDVVKVQSNGSDHLKIRENLHGVSLFWPNLSQTSVFFGQNSGNIFNPDPVTSRTNSAFGYSTLDQFVSGSNNTAIGAHSMTMFTTGSSNTAVGAFSLSSNIDGSGNTALGEKALNNHQFDAFSGAQTAVGFQALASDIRGFNTVGIGTNTALLDTTAMNSVYIGSSAGSGGTGATYHSKSDNVMIGHLCGLLAQGSGNVYLGHQAGFFAKGDNQLYIDNSSADSTEALIYGQFDNDLLRFNASVNIDDLYTLPVTSPSSGQVLSSNGSSQLIWSSLFQPWSDNAGNDISYTIGNVGVGNNSPDFILDVSDNQSSDFVARIKNSNAGSNCDGLLVEAGPKTGNPGSSAIFIDFQKSGGSTTLGNISGNGGGGIAYNQSSDRRLKQNIEDYNSGLSTVMKIQPRTYQMKVSPDREEVGFIAQELYEVIPQIVAGSPSDDLKKDGPMAVDYGRITPVLVAAIQEQQAAINVQNAMIQSLSDRLEAIEKSQALLAEKE